MKYRLALDMGTNSIGWAIFRLHKVSGEKRDQPRELIRIGSRIFPEGRDPKSQESLGAKRRIPRSQRRHRDRYLQRRTNLLNCLQRHELFPPLGTPEARSLQLLNPYELRTDGLDTPLTPYQLGRALFHLNQRRGFKSNRKTDSKDNESGKIKQGIRKLVADMDQYHIRTVGEALYERLQHNPEAGVRARMRGTGAKAEYDFYVDRSLVEDEFEALWNAQRPHYPELLTNELHDQLYHIIFHQRPLKEPPIGRCTLEPEQPRAPKALLTAQYFRLYQEVNHLRLLHPSTGEERSLTRTERDKLIQYLEQRKEATYVALRKQLFGKDLYNVYSFTIENSAIARTKVIGNTTNSRLAHKKAFGKTWYRLDRQIQDEIVNKLLKLESEADSDNLIAWLQKEHQLSQDSAAYIACEVKLESGYLRFSQCALTKVLPHLQSGWDAETDQPYTYDQAVRAARYADHRIPITDELRDQLPYYGEILWRHCQDIPTVSNPDEIKHGRITNPTVHIGLNQLRQLVNAIMRRYGRPAEIHIELTRELKLSQTGIAETNKLNAQNRALNERLNDELKNQCGISCPTAQDRLKLKLFKELGPLNSYCIYSGEPIHYTDLFNGTYQIDHILPFSQTLDDSFNNKVLVTRQANADKGNLLVHELCRTNSRYNWEDIQNRTAALSYNKNKRFAPDALEQWLTNSGRFKRDGADFIQRQLTDTAYFSRVTREYLQQICPDNKIVSSPGRLTAMLRAKWGLNKVLSNDQEKNRNDHRHHAIDAVVIGLVDRSLLQKVATLAGQRKEQNTDNLLKGIHAQLPFPELTPQIRDAVKRCIVSHKPDHNPQAQLHEETAYGIVAVLDEKKHYYQTRHRVALTSLTRKNIDNLEDSRLSTRLKNLTEGYSDTKLKQTLAELVPPKWPQKAYLLRPISGVPIALKGTALSPNLGRRSPNHAKLYKTAGNYCYEIYRTEQEKWDGDVIRTFDANQKEYQSFMSNKKVFHVNSFYGKSLVMRLMKNDMLAIEESGKRIFFRIQKMSEGIICLCEHHEANVDKRNADTKNSFRYIYKSPDALRKVSARKVTVSLLGQIRDPGFKA
ncbi:MAG: type II CRISPR RNA-guided endonuclease Cas9 [Pseudomonadota bacterium]